MAALAAPSAPLLSKLARETSSPCSPKQVAVLVPFSLAVAATSVLAGASKVEAIDDHVFLEFELS